MKVTIYQYPRGSNRGGFLDTDICPTISCSSFQHNCFLVICYESDPNLSEDGIW